MYDLTTKLWCDPHTLERNRLPVRTFFWPYRDEAAALADDRGRALCLSGQWRFRWFPSALMVTEDVICQEPAAGWDDIRVPRSWQFAGYGRFLYTDEAYPFPVDPPFVPAQHETGVYRRAFEVSCAPGERYVLRLDGAESACEVYVNGLFAGYTQGSRLPAEFDLTALCRAGANDLCLVVHQYCDGSYLEDQDMWWLGGIIRDVYLLTRYDSRIDDVILDTDYDAETRTGSLRIRTRLQGKGRVAACLLADDGRVIRREEGLPADVRWNIGAVEPWNAEEPRLYTLLVTLKDENGETVETVRQRVGFRRVEIRDGELRVNGRRIMLRGVNRHEFSPVDGRAVDEQSTRADLLMMKKHHINAVRTSHYPDAPYFYDLCDELGLYVMDECDLETHGFEIEGIPTRLVEDPEWKEAYLDRLYRTVGRDRNHACVILWSLGNESYWGSNFFAMYDWVHREDPTRPVHYEGDRGSTHADLTSSMYTSVGGLAELDASVTGKPHILCEFAHAMGNGPGSLTEYVELMERSRRIQGYFVWEWRDHGVYTERADGKRCYRYGGEFGEDYHSGNFCMDGLLATDSTPTPGFYAYAKAVEPFHAEMDARGRVTLESRFAFRTVPNASVRWTLRADGETAAEQEQPLAPIAPGSVTVLEAPRELLPVAAQQNAHRTLTASFAAGTEELGSAAAVLETYAPRAEEPKGTVRVLETPERIAVAGERFSLYVSLDDGRIRDYVANGQVLAELGPTPDLFRAYLDNDAAPAREWTKKNLHSMVPTVLNARWEMRESCAVITLRLRYGANARNWRVLAEVRYAVCADGTTGVSMRGRFDGDFGDRRGDAVPRLGTTLRLPGCYQQAAYCGRGPGETYCDSRQNGRKDVFYTTVDGLAFPYECPQDSGNRTDTNWIVLYDSTAGLAVASATGRDVSAHNCESRDLWKAAHACDVPRRPFVELHVDARNAGLGSGSCGPGPLIGYTAQTVPFDIRYALAPMGVQGPLAAARHAGDVLAAVDRWL